MGERYSAQKGQMDANRFVSCVLKAMHRRVYAVWSTFLQQFPSTRPSRLRRDKNGFVCFLRRAANQILASAENKRTKRMKRKEVSCFIV
jgi:hypothetical protein